MSETLGRKDDTFEEALAKMATRDPSLWRILHVMCSRITQVRLLLVLLSVLGITNNKVIDHYVPFLNAFVGEAAMIWTFNRAEHTLAHPVGTPGKNDFAQWSCAAHGEAIPMPAGPLPTGTFSLGAPEFNEPDEADDLRSMGPYFIPVQNVPGHEGIGIHGGGSASPHPLAARQGWYPTENCIRLQNVDLYHVVENWSPGDELIVE